MSFDGILTLVINPNATVSLMSTLKDYPIDYPEKYILWGIMKKYYNRVTDIDAVNAVIMPLIEKPYKINKKSIEQTCRYIYAVDHPIEMLFYYLLSSMRVYTVRGVMKSAYCNIDLLKIYANYVDEHFIFTKLNTHETFCEHYVYFIEYNKYVQLCKKYKTCVKLPFIHLAHKSPLPLIEYLNNNYSINLLDRRHYISIYNNNYYGFRDQYYNYFAQHTDCKRYFVAGLLGFEDLLYRDNVIITDEYVGQLERIKGAHDYMCEKAVLHLLRNGNYRGKFKYEINKIYNHVMMEIYIYLFDNDLAYFPDSMCNLQYVNNINLAYSIVQHIIRCGDKYTPKKISAENVQIVPFAVYEGLCLEIIGTKANFANYKEFIEKLQPDSIFLEFIKNGTIVSIDEHLVFDNPLYMRAMLCNTALRDRYYDLLEKYDTPNDMGMTIKSAAKV